MIVHSGGVREFRTSVKGVESVLAFCDDAYMPTVGESLLALKERSGLSLDAIAAAAQYRGKSSIQEYFKREYEGPLGGKAASRLADALVGKGTPPITAEEIGVLTSALPGANVGRRVNFEGAALDLPHDDLPVYGTAMAAERVIDGDAIEQTSLNTGEIIHYAKRPAVLYGVEGAYALYVAGCSMEPAFFDGGMVVAQRRRPVRAGDFVVVYLRAQGEADDGARARMVMVKRFLRRTAQFVELQQYQPELTFRVAAEDVVEIDRVMRMDEVLN